MTKIPDAAYQGTRGAFSELAAKNLLSEDALLLPRRRIRDVFETVRNGEANFGVIAWKNTIAGAVLGSYNLIVEFSEMSIIGETKNRIDHAVIGIRGSSLDQIRRIYSHPVALAQCELFFVTHPEIQPWPEWDTAGSVAKVIRDDIGDAAAIAGARNAEIYGGDILAEGIQDDPNNFTRFMLISREPLMAEITGLAKTTIVFDLENVPSQMLNALKPFSERGLNIPEFDTRQIRGMPDSTYRFYMDVESAPQQMQALQEGLEELRKQNMKFRVLGTYPAYNTEIHERRPPNGAQDSDG